MNRIAERYDDPPRRSADPVGAYLQIDLPKLISWLRHGWRWIALAMLIGALAGIAYALVAKPRYTVTTDLLMNPGGLQIVSDDLFSQNVQQRDAQLLNVESKRQTLVSRSVLQRVISVLDLQKDPEFVPPLSMLSGLLGRSSQSSDLTALQNLARRVDARRDELSFVVTLSVWSNDAAKSIRVSEAIVKAFREELVSADTAGASRTADALTARIAKLKADVSTAEEAVETFRRDNGLQSAQGELMSSRSMSQINQQLVDARQKLIAAQSRYQELTSGDADAIALQSSTISALRTQYATLKSQADAQSAIYGPKHPRANSQQIELNALQNQIDAETRRVVLAARNDLDQARSVVSSLESEAARAGVGVFSDNNAQVRLRELTREAAAKTAIYEAFLVRAREATERQQLDTTDIRVISPPVAPKTRSWPPPMMQLAAFGALAGMVLGVMSVLGRNIVAEMTGTPAQPPRRAPMRLEARSFTPHTQPRSMRQGWRAPARAGSLLDPRYTNWADGPQPDVRPKRFE